MSIRPTTENDLILCRKVCRGTVWAQAAIGAILLYSTMNAYGHGVLLLLLLASLLLTCLVGDRKGARIVRAILHTFVLAFVLGVAGIALILTVRDGVSLTENAADLIVICGLLLPYLSVGAVCALLHPGEVRVGMYERVVACVFQGLTLLLAALVAFDTPAQVYIVWGLDHPLARLLFFVIAAATALLTAVCAFARPATPEK